MERTSTFIKETPQYLRTCILYEVLQKKPIFDSYLNFCDSVGKDAMNYPDFEYWYYRFYHGNRDLDYDRSVDPEPKTFADIPLGTLTKIMAEYLGPVERTVLRSMNHTIKDISDSFPPNFEKLKIVVSYTDVSWSLDNTVFWCYKAGSGCKFYRPNSREVEKSEGCYIKKSLKYLNPLFKIPNLQVNHFLLHFYEKIPDREDLMPVPLNAKSASIYGHNKNKAIQFFLALTPGYLESIKLDVRCTRGIENYANVLETEQFKQAKHVEFGRYMQFNVADLVHFSHLKTFKYRVISDNTVEDVQRIRDIIPTFKEYESCELRFTTREDRFPMREFALALGEEVPLGPFVPPLITHRYQIPEFNDCLEFKIRSDDYCCCVDIVKVR
ncbi:hypothetical protein B9Z55_027031 [Caenorhabditis nigoni]|uniref:F-box domain-containing protein n=1 Tax=Caenorhabditis nigoni TaxID=1611254 RepID=A0A2G5SIK5_9PELO|nr:hypothetical protein B9Z55_027031 [Caenorhabditis nigoni]